MKGMKFSFLGVAGLVAAIVYLSGALLLSQYSREGFRELQAYSERLEGNVEQLRELNRGLVAQAELYRRSSDAVTVQARPLQYYEPGQEVIRLGDGTDRSTTRSPGTILRRPARPPDRRAYIRVAALIAFLLALFVQLAVEPGDRRAQQMRRASR